MNSTIVRFSLLALSLSLMVGCATITSASPGLNAATGDAWYTKDHRFLSISIGTDIYYCPKAGTACYRARVE